MSEFNNDIHKQIARRNIHTMEQTGQLNGVRVALSSVDFLEKGKKLPIGTVREHGGKKVKKTATGWVPVKSDKNSYDKQKQSEPKAKVSVRVQGKAGNKSAQELFQDLLGKKKEKTSSSDTESNNEAKSIYDKYGITKHADEVQDASFASQMSDEDHKELISSIVAEGQVSKSKGAQALHELGLKTADIARSLGMHYSHAHSSIKKVKKDDMKAEKKKEEPKKEEKKASEPKKEEVKAEKKEEPKVEKSEKEYQKEVFERMDRAYLELKQIKSNPYNHSQESISEIKKEFAAAKREAKKVGPEIKAGGTYSVEELSATLGLYSFSRSHKKKWLKENSPSPKEQKTIEMALNDHTYGDDAYGQTDSVQSFYDIFNKHSDPTNIKLTELENVKEEVKSNNIYEIMAAPQKTKYRAQFDVKMPKIGIVTVQRERWVNTTHSQRDINSFM